MRSRPWLRPLHGRTKFRARATRCAYPVQMLGRTGWQGPWGGQLNIRHGGTPAASAPPSGLHPRPSVLPQSPAPLALPAPGLRQQRVRWVPPPRQRRPASRGPFTEKFLAPVGPAVVAVLGARQGRVALPGMPLVELQGAVDEGEVAEGLWG